MGRKKNAWDYTRNEPITEENIKKYVSDVSKMAQDAERRGDKRDAEAAHAAINRELADWKRGDFV